MATKRCLAISFLALAAALLGGCGGGGGSGGGETVVVPGPSGPTLPLTPPNQPPSRVEIVLKSDDRVGGGALSVGNIEDGALADDGTIGAIVSVDRPGARRAVIRRLPGKGSFEIVFDERSAPPDVDLQTLVRLRMAPTGEMVFQAGRGVDTDRLFLIQGDEVRVLAGEPPGVVAPDFRVLGSVRVGRSGLVAFVAGGGDCRIETTSGGSIRNICAIRLYVYRDGSIERIGAGSAELEEERTTNVRVEIDAAGAAYFSVPGRHREPTVLRVDESGEAVLLRADSELSGVGAALRNPEVIDAGSDGSLLVIGELPAPAEGERRPDALGIVADGRFEPIAVEGEIVDGLPVKTVRATGVDAEGAVLYELTLADPDTPDGRVRSLRLRGSDGEDVEIAREGAPAPDGGGVIVSLGSSRMSEAGDVVFVASLGQVTSETTFIEEIRATARRPDGSFVTLASSEAAVQLGTVSRLSIVGLDDQGDVLLLAERGSSSNRALLLARTR